MILASYPFTTRPYITPEVYNPIKSKNLHYHKEEDQLKAVEQLIHAGYKPKAGKWVKDTRIQ